MHACFNQNDKMNIDVLLVLVVIVATVINL